jgi:hypothetical protein
MNEIVKRRLDSNEKVKYHVRMQKLKKCCKLKKWYRRILEYEVIPYFSINSTQLTNKSGISEFSILHNSSMDAKIY